MATDEQQAETLRALRRICKPATHLVESDPPARCSFGIPALDELIPGRGIEAGSLVEWIVPAVGSGVEVVALQSMRGNLHSHRLWAVVDPKGEFHPPAACGWGLPLEWLLLLRPASTADAIWAVEQCLRCPAVGFTWFSAEGLSDRVVQRWKRAIEVGGGIGMLFRPVDTVCRSSWADIRWSVHSRPRQDADGRIVRVELVFCRGGFSSGAVDLELHDATGDVCVVPPVANPASVERATRTERSSVHPIRGNST